MIRDAVREAVSTSLRAAIVDSEIRSVEPLMTGKPRTMEEEDTERWRVLIDTPDEASIDSVSSSDLYLVPEDGYVHASSSTGASADAVASPSSLSKSSTSPPHPLESSLLSSSASSRPQDTDIVTGLNLSLYPGATTQDPFSLVAPQIEGLNASIRSLLGVDHPVLSRVASYFFAGAGGGGGSSSSSSLAGQAASSVASAALQASGLSLGVASLASSVMTNSSSSGIASSSSSSSSSSSGGGKKIRAAMVLLMSQAVNDHMVAMSLAGGATTSSSLPPPALSQQPAPYPLQYYPVASFRQNVSLPQHPTTSSGGTATASSYPVPSSLPQQQQQQHQAYPHPILPPHVVAPLQRRLAEITELIHAASLLHDDVIDSSDTRRGGRSVNSVFGNKLAILGGDFLLARASVCLARLRNIPVVELLSTVIEHLVKGEVIQMKTAHLSPTSRERLGGFGKSITPTRRAFDEYLRKTYYKTGSLMANSCKAIALLGYYPESVSNAAFKYGLHVGVAFQLVDDLLDFEGTAAQLGKPTMADLKAGLATAPVLFAAQKYPNLLKLIERKFEAPGDVDIALEHVHAANGLASTRRLALAHGQMAVDALNDLSPSPARTALAALVTKVLNRKA